MISLWALSLSAGGAAACALSPDMAHQTCSASWEETTFESLRAVAPKTVQSTVCALLRQLLDTCSEPPLAIALTSPHQQTALFVDTYGAPVSDILLNEPLPFPARDIPDQFAANPASAQCFKMSPLRRLRMRNPAFRLNLPTGLWTLGACVAQYLTDVPADACLPFGVPRAFPDFDDDFRLALFDALGFCEKNTFHRVRTAHPFAKIPANNPISPKLSGVPVFHVGATNAALSYATAADPVHWAINVSDGLSASWHAGISATSAYEISVTDAISQNLNQKNKNIEQNQELSRDAWTYRWHEKHRLSQAPGPRPFLSTYAFDFNAQSQLIDALLRDLPRDSSKRFAFDAIAHAPVGSDGIHFLPQPNGLHIVGLKPAHAPCHMLRARFESLFYELRAVRNLIPAVAKEPVRLLLSEPWPTPCAQIAADILNAPLFLPELPPLPLAAFGAALALLRSLDIPELQRPNLPAAIVEPSPSAAIYQTHFDIHCALRDALND